MNEGRKEERVKRDRGRQERKTKWNWVSKTWKQLPQDMQIVDPRLGIWI
jgi:hypothetical protein